MSPWIHSDAQHGPMSKRVLITGRLAPRRVHDSKQRYPNGPEIPACRPLLPQRSRRRNWCSPVSEQLALMASSSPARRTTQANVVCRSARQLPLRGSTSSWPPPWPMASVASRHSQRNSNNPGLLVVGQGSGDRGAGSGDRRAEWRNARNVKKRAGRLIASSALDCTPRGPYSALKARALLTIRNRGGAQRR